MGNNRRDTIDPRTVLKHELGHLLRLKHPTNMKYKTTDVMWFNAKDMMGEHPRKLSNHDIQQAKLLRLGLLVELPIQVKLLVQF